MAESEPRIKTMRLRYAGTCGCGAAVEAGSQAGWDRELRQVVCASCLRPPEDVEAPAPVADVPRDLPGASLRNEYERRAAAREARVRARFPRAGGILLSLTSEPAHIAAFKTGARGEAVAAERIIGRCGEDVLFLLNRKLGKGRRDGDIDMLAIGAAGVFVIDVKHYRHAKVEIRRTGGLFSPRVEHLYVGGRDRSAWMSSLARQREAVEAALGRYEETAGVPVTQLLCFVDAELPLLSRLSIGDIAIYGARELGRKLRDQEGPLDAEQRSLVWQALHAELPPAAS